MLKENVQAAVNFFVCLELCWYNSMSMTTYWQFHDYLELFCLIYFLLLCKKIFTSIMTISQTDKFVFEQELLSVHFLICSFHSWCCFSFISEYSWAWIDHGDIWIESPILSSHWAVQALWIYNVNIGFYCQLSFNVATCVCYCQNSPVCKLSCTNSKTVWKHFKTRGIE